jgi:hypothetical protein
LTEASKNWLILERITEVASTTVEGQLEIDFREPAKVEVGENVEADAL